MHNILTTDTGLDGSRRWAAQTSWMRLFEYGSTEQEAVNELRKTLTNKYPAIKWFAGVPVKRLD